MTKFDGEVPSIRTLGVIEANLGHYSLVVFPLIAGHDLVEISADRFREADIVPEKGEIFAADIPQRVQHSEHLRPFNLGPFVRD